MRRPCQAADDSPAAVFDVDVLDAILNSSPALDVADSFVASANTVDTADADGADAVTPAPAPANAAQDAGGVHNSDKSGANKRKRLHSDLDELAKQYEEKNGKYVQSRCTAEPVQNGHDVPLCTLVKTSTKVSTATTPLS